VEKRLGDEVVMAVEGQALLIRFRLHLLMYDPDQSQEIQVGEEDSLKTGDERCFQ
jgi:hypothetical protein